MYKRQLAEKGQQAEEPVKAQAAVEAAAAEASWDDVAMLDPLGLAVGYRLISLVDHTQNGELLHRIPSLRKQFAQEVGFLPPVGPIDRKSVGAGKRVADRVELGGRRTNK